MTYIIDSSGRKKERVAEITSSILTARIILSTNAHYAYSTSWSNEGDESLLYLDGSLITGKVQFEVCLRGTVGSAPGYAALGYYDPVLGWTVIDDSIISETSYPGGLGSLLRRRSSVFELPNYYTSYSLFMKSSSTDEVTCDYSVIIITPDGCDPI